jgi:hypothetical protein
MLLGSVAEAVIRLASCPVYVVRPKLGAQVHPADTAPLRAACERCLEVRRVTLGEIFWCDEHRGNRPSSEVRAHQPHASS